MTAAWPGRLRAIALWLLVVLGSLAFGAYVVVHWVERQILTTDNWVALVGPLPKQPVVATALGSYISQQVFAELPVQQKIADALPPKASFLAGPLASQLNSLTTAAAQKLAASDAFQTIWSGANQIAMNRLVAMARGQTPPLQQRINERFDINLSDASGKLRDALGKASDAIPALAPASNQAIQLSVNLQARRERLHQAIRAMDLAAAVLPLFIMACLGWALAISHHRRKTVIAITLIAGGLMLLELILIKALRQNVLDQVRNSANLAAVGYVYDALAGWLRRMIFTVLIALLVILFVAVLAGPSRWAVAIREYVHLGKLAQSRPLAWWRTARTWTGQHQAYLWAGIVVIVLGAVALFLPVNNRIVLNAILLTLSLGAIAKIFGTPPATAPTVASAKPKVAAVT